MGRNKAVSLCVALVFGSVFAVAVSNWEEQGAGPLANGHQHAIQPAMAESPASRQPELLAESIQRASSPLLPGAQADPAEVVPASFKEPAIATVEPALLPVDGPTAEPLPAELTPDEPAPAADETPVADRAEPTPAEGVPAEESPAVDQPAADDEAAQADPAAAVDAPTVAWHDDYGQAMDAAIEQQRMLLDLLLRSEPAGHPAGIRAAIAGRSQESRDRGPGFCGSQAADRCRDHQ